MKYLPVTEARSVLPALVDSGGRTVITKHGKPVAVLISFDVYTQLRGFEALFQDRKRVEALLAELNRLEAGDRSQLKPVEAARANTR